MVDPFLCLLVTNNYLYILLIKLEQEERRLNMLRKCSKSTMASPTTSPLTEEPFISNYYDASKQSKSSFWDQVKR